MFTVRCLVRYGYPQLPRLRTSLERINLFYADLFEKIVSPPGGHGLPGGPDLRHFFQPVTAC